MVPRKIILAESEQLCSTWMSIVMIQDFLTEQSLSLRPYHMSEMH